MTHIPGHKDDGALRNQDNGEDDDGVAAFEQLKAFKAAGVEPPTQVGQPVPETVTIPAGEPTPTPTLPPAPPPTPTGEEPEEKPEQVADFFEVPDIGALMDEFQDAFNDPALQNLFNNLIPALQFGDAQEPGRLAGEEAALSLGSLLKQLWANRPTLIDQATGETYDPRNKPTTRAEADRSDFWVWNTNTGEADVSFEAGLILDDYANNLRDWQATVLSGLQTQSNVEFRIFDTTMAVVGRFFDQRFEAQIRQAEAAARAFEAGEQREFVAGQAGEERGFRLDLLEQQDRFARDRAFTAFEREKDLLLIQHQNALKVVGEQARIAQEAADAQRRWLGHQNDLNRAISEGNLNEMVRTNKALEAISLEQNRIIEQRDKWDFLGSLLATGGLGFFTMAMINPEAAGALFEQLSGQQATPGAFAGIPAFGAPRGPVSAQSLAGATPLELARLESFGQGQGRDLILESQRLTPASFGGVQRIR